MTEIDYRNKVILAPMVRVGTLPFRILALKFGADIVYSEEIIDKKLCATTRVVNETLGTIDYVSTKNNKDVVWRTCPLDTPTVVQIGTATAEWAQKAAMHIYADCDAIDVNMGCPKHFSVHGGMGSMLLSDPERIKQILSTLVRVIDKPITCKIRILESMQDTIDLVKIIEQTGVKAIGVHARYIPQRPRDPAHLHLLKQIKDAVSIPVIANGDIFSYKDIEKVREISGCSSVMVARGALWNPSIFSPISFNKDSVLKSYLEEAVKWDNHFGHTKYTMVRSYQNESKNPIYPFIVKARKNEHLLDAFKDVPNIDFKVPVQENKDEFEVYA